MSRFSLNNPQFLFALFFIAVVLLIHFLQRTRVLNIDFSTLRFFNQKAALARKSRVLKKILQLITRCLIVTTVVLLFAAPVDKSDPLNELSKSQKSIYIWIDNTLSMEYIDRQYCLGQLSINLVDTLLKVFPAVKKYYYDHSKETFDQECKIDDFISSYKSSDLNRALDIIKNSDLTSDPVIILFSDFQVPLTKSLNEKLSEFKRKITVICVNVAPDTPWNYSINNTKTHNGSIYATIKTQGKSLNNADLIAEKENMRFGKLTLQIPQNKDTVIQIQCKSKSDDVAGCLSMKITDPLLFDNSTFFYPENSNSKRIVIVGDTIECIPIALALKTASRHFWKKITIKDASRVTFDELDSANLIIVNKIMGQSGSLRAFLNDSTQIKKPVIFCYGAEEEECIWSETVLAEMLPFTGKRLLKQFATPLSPVLPDTNSEIWQNFKQFLIDDISIYKMCIGIDGEVLLRLTDGSALMIGTEDVKGRKWLIVATPIGITNANNFSESGFFVPFVDRICRHMISLNQHSKEIRIAGMAYKNPFSGSGRNFTVFDIESKNIKNVLNNQFYYSFDKPGIYKIISQNEQPDFVVVQHDSNESILKYESPGSNESILTIKDDQFISEIRKTNRNHLFNLLWWLLAGLFVVDILLWESARTVNLKINNN